MHYPNAIHNANTKPDLQLIGWIALQDRTLTAEQLNTIARDLRAKADTIKAN